MKTKAKCILGMIAMCILITPAFSQGGERDGRNGNPGSNMGPAQDSLMMSGPNGAPFGQDGGIGQGQAPVVPRFNGCNTRLQKVLATNPIKPPSDAPDGQRNEFGPKDAPHDEPAPWSNFGQENGVHGGTNFGFKGPDEHAPPRSIMGHDYQKTHHRKSLMEEKHEMRHKENLMHLIHNNLPEMPPMKSIMNHGR